MSKSQNTTTQKEKMAELMMDIVPKTMQLLREEMRSSRGGELTVPQFRVLAAIGRGLCFNKLIGDLLGVSEAATSRMIDGLVKDGFVKKTENPDDRRQTILALTAKGSKFHQETKLNARLQLMGRLDRLSNDELEQVINGLSTLQSVFNRIIE